MYFFSYILKYADTVITAAAVVAGLNTIKFNTTTKKMSITTNLAVNQVCIPNMFGEYKITFHNGDSLEGSFVDSVMEGNFSYIFADGSKSFLVFKNGKQQSERLFFSIENNVSIEKDNKISIPDFHDMQKMEMIY